MSVTPYTGVSFDNLRKALYIMFFGVDNGACQTFDSPKYRYIIPLQGNFDNPLEDVDEKVISKNTFIKSDT